MKYLKKNREINIVNISFVDLLTGALGGLALILFGYMMVYKNISKENFKETILITEDIAPLHIGEDINFAFSAQGGLEPYEWEFYFANEKECKNNLPPGIFFDTSKGKLKGTLGYIDNKLHDDFININFPVKYCFSVSVESKGKPDSEETKRQLNSFKKNFKKKLRLENEALSEEKIEELYLIEIEKYFKKSNFFIVECWPPLFDNHPVAQATLLPDAVVNESYEYYFKGISGKAPYKWIKSELQETSFIGKNGKKILPKVYPKQINNKFLWVPNEVGTLHFSIVIGDFYHSPSYQKSKFELNVIPTPMAYYEPKILTKQLPDAFRLEKYYVQLSVINGLLPYTWKQKGLDLSEGLHLNDEGIIYGISEIRFKDKATHADIPFEIMVTDSKGNSDTQKVNLIIRNRVKEIPQIEIITTQRDLKKHKFYYQKEIDPFEFKATGGDTSQYKWNISTEPINVGLYQFSDTGKVLGKPNIIDKNPFYFIVQLEDGFDTSNKNPLKFEFYVKPEELKIETEHLDIGVMNLYYKNELLATGGVKPYTWDLTFEPEANWVNSEVLNQGIISGTPKTPLEYRVTMRLTDSWRMQPKNYKYIDLVINQQLKIETQELQNAIVKKDYAQKLKASGGIEPYNWRVKFTPNIEWLNSGFFNKNSGMFFLNNEYIEGVPTQCKVYNVILLLSDSTSVKPVTKKLYLTVTKETKIPNPPLYDLNSQESSAKSPNFSGTDEGNCDEDPKIRCVLREGFTGLNYSNTVLEGIKFDNPQIIEGILPHGLSLNKNVNNDNLTIEGIPQLIGSYIFTLSIQLESDVQRTQLYKMRVHRSHRIILNVGYVGNVYEYDFPPEIKNMELHSSSINELPEGMELIKKGQIYCLKGKPRKEGKYDLTFDIEYKNKKFTQSYYFAVELPSFLKLWRFIMNIF